MYVNAHSSILDLPNALIYGPHAAVRKLAARAHLGERRFLVIEDSITHQFIPSMGTRETQVQQVQLRT